jgi:flagellar biosynthesis protein FlhF
MLPTPYRPQETRSVVDRYHGLEPDRIIAARMDESLQAGAVCSLAAELGTPISFITSGDAIPDGLEHASIERLMRVIGVESGGVA